MLRLAAGLVWLGDCLAKMRNCISGFCYFPDLCISIETGDRTSLGNPDCLGQVIGLDFNMIEINQHYASKVSCMSWSYSKR